MSLTPYLSVVGNREQNVRRGCAAYKNRPCMNIEFYISLLGPGGGAL